MIQKLRPYSKYKDSGVEWFGKVPEHWEVRRLGSVVQILNGATPSSGVPEYWNGDIVWVTPEDLGKLRGRYIENSARKITREGYSACGTTLAHLGSIAISTRAPIGHLGILHVSACVNQGCRLLEPRNTTNSEYLYYALVSLRTELQAFGQGSTFTELSRSKLAVFPILHPPSPEQTAIVWFLDWAEGRIRQVIQAREKRIKLLEEYKQVLIHQAVTGQIDVRTGKPYSKYKDSDVEWLGKVPEHWEVRRLRQVALMLVSNVDKHTKEGEIEVHLCNYVDVYKNERITADIRFMRATASPDEIRRFRLRCGDVVITKDSEIWNDVGVPALVEYEAPDLVYGYHLAILRPYRNQLIGPYLLRAFQSQRVATQLHVAANGVTRFGLSHNAIKNAQIPVPPLPEQTAIVEFLDEQTKKIDAAITADRRAIELLNEFRTRLIADVIKGKLDVRDLPATPNAAQAGVAAKIPEESDEKETGLLDQEETAGQEVGKTDDTETLGEAHG